MKQIGPFDPLPPDRVGIYCGCVTYGVKYHLKCEDGEWIFRHPVGLQGHSGPHRRRDEAVDMALSAPGTQCFEFDTPEELAKWLKEP